MEMAAEMGIAKVQARRAIHKLVRRYIGPGEWGSQHYRVSSALIQAWMRGVAEADLEQWLVNRYRLAPINKANT